MEEEAGKVVALGDRCTVEDAAGEIAEIDAGEGVDLASVATEFNDARVPAKRSVLNDFQKEGAKVLCLDILLYACRGSELLLLQTHIWLLMTCEEESSQ